LWPTLCCMCKWLYADLLPSVKMLALGNGYWWYWRSHFGRVCMQ